MHRASFSRSTGICLSILVLPFSSNYQLRDFGFGAGGVRDSSSSNYRLNAITGEVSEDQLSGTNYKLNPGLEFVQQAHVPPAPTFTNPSNYYNKLKIVLDTGNNPSDTLFAIAISSDGFTTTSYVQSDMTVGATLGSEDYRTYTQWGGASGSLIIGLTPSTTYTVKVKAIHGDFTETPYGPSTTAATVATLVSFDIDVASSDQETAAPFAIDLGTLAAGSVVDSSEKVWVDFTTNAEAGGRVYIVGTNAGLKSDHATHTISAVSGNLASVSEGFGAQGSSAAQGSGGPLSISALYNVGGNSVGATDTAIREIFQSDGPITSGRGSFLLKAKSSSVTPAAIDYTESLTMIAAATF